MSVQALPLSCRLTAFTNDSEYIRDLVKRDQSQQDRLATLREVIAEGLDSGPSDESLDEIWSDAEARAARG